MALSLIQLLGMYELKLTILRNNISLAIAVGCIGLTLDQTG